MTQTKWAPDEGAHFDFRHKEFCASKVDSMFLEKAERMRMVVKKLTIAAVLMAMAGVGQAQLNDGNGAFKTGHYRDLFAERGHSAVESNAKIEAAFQELFHGDKQTQTVYFEAGRNANGPLAYVTDWANNDARTEGMSYGMMIAVELNKKHEFDAIWNWAHTYMLITDPKNPSVGYFAWSLNTDGTPRSTGAAPDGEEYFVMSLYFAAHRWGNGKGIYN
jgi:oligosaccharide reducing-end xylanase